MQIEDEKILINIRGKCFEEANKMLDTIKSEQRYFEGAEHAKLNALGKAIRFLDDLLGIEPEYVKEERDVKDEDKDDKYHDAVFETRILED